MSISPRAIALQGIGSAALVIALQGFSSVDAAPPPVIPRVESGGFGTPLVLPIPPYLRQQLEDDELVFTVIALALQSGLLDPQ